jgi:hypothetical protein
MQSASITGIPDRLCKGEPRKYSLATVGMTVADTLGVCSTILPPTSAQEMSLWILTQLSQARIFEMLSKMQ